MDIRLNPKTCFYLLKDLFAQRNRIVVINARSSTTSSASQYVAGFFFRLAILLNAFSNV